MISVVFTGSYEHTLDPKGRLILPAKFREQFQAGGYMTQPTGQCLALFTRPVFDEVAAMHRERQRTGDEELANQARGFFSRSFDFVPDAQGRIPVPQVLRDKVGIDREVTVIGNSTRVEIWDRERWALEDSQQDIRINEQFQGRDISF